MSRTKSSLVLAISISNQTGFVDYWLTMCTLPAGYTANEFTFDLILLIQRVTHQYLGRKVQINNIVSLFICVLIKYAKIDSLISCNTLMRLSDTQSIIENLCEAKIYIYVFLGYLKLQLQYAFPTHLF